MKTTYFFIILIALTIAIQSGCVTNPGYLLSNQSSGGVDIYYDPVNKFHIATTCISGYSQENTLISFDPIDIYLIFEKEILPSIDTFRLRTVFQANLKYWPIQPVCYFMLDEETYHLAMVNVSANGYHLEEENSVTNPDGTLMVSTSNEEYHLYKFEANVPQEMIMKLNASEEISFVFFSGNLPLSYSLKQGEKHRLKRLIGFTPD